MSKQSDLAKGTFSGDLTVDTNTLVVDSVNNRVGVGTANPTEEIHGYSSGGDFSLKLESASATGTAYTYYKNADRQWATGIRGSVGDSYQIIDSNADTARLVIDTSGRVTMPYQTSASYYGTGNSIAMATGWNLLGGSGSGLNVSWSTSGGYNIGSNFDTTNGRFTAPIAGRYLFYIASLSTLGSTNATAYVGLRLAKNGSFTYDLDEGGYYVSKAGTDAQFWPKVTTILNLAQGDYVHAEVYSPVSTSLVQRDSSRFMYSLLG